MERLKVFCNLQLFDWRNIVKLPVITVKLFSIVLQCSAALLLCIISFGATAGYRRATKLLQRQVTGTLPVLKGTILALARSQRFLEEFTRNQLLPLGGMMVNTTMMNRISTRLLLTNNGSEFHSEKLICWLFEEFRVMHLHWAMIFCLCVACFLPVTGNIYTQIQCI